MTQMNTMYGATARFDTGRALTEDELRRQAPSIFATTAHHSRSERFRTIPTIEILRGLANEGFFPVGARQSVSRSRDKVPFAKHLVRLRKLDDQKLRTGDTVFEALLQNANDGSSAYELLGGLFRILCLNSLVEQSGTIDAIKVRHSGDAVAHVIEGTYRVLGNAEKALAAPQVWSQIDLEHDERIALAAAAHTLRFTTAEGDIKTPIRPVQLLVPRREADRGHDLWTTHNVIQESIIRGGLTGTQTTADGRRRNITTRPINGIDADIRLNKALWVLSEHLAASKTAKA